MKLTDVLFTFGIVGLCFWLVNIIIWHPFFGGVFLIDIELLVLAYLTDEQRYAR